MAEKSVTEITLDKVKDEWRQQWEDELLSDEAVGAGARGFAEGFSLPNHPCRTNPCGECLDDADRVLRAALAATRKTKENPDG